ncbi:hypothetical protein Hanom_Chr06g00539411 [Helianthus anomalus]
MKDAEVEVSAVEIEVNVAENEVNNDLAIVPTQSFTLVGKSKEVYYSKEVSLRRIEVERRCLKAKMRMFEDDNDEQIKKWFGDEDDEHHDDKDDKGNDDDDQDGAGGVLIVKPSGTSLVDDYLNDEQNEERDEAQQ